MLPARAKATPSCRRSGHPRSEAGRHPSFPIVMAGSGPPPTPFSPRDSRDQCTAVRFNLEGGTAIFAVMLGLDPTGFTDRGNENLAGVDNGIFSPSWPGLSGPTPPAPCRDRWPGQALPDSQIAETNFVCRALYRHGPACPGHLSRHGAGGVGPDKPGHDGEKIPLSPPAIFSFRRSVNPVGTSRAMTV